MLFISCSVLIFRYKTVCVRIKKINDEIFKQAGPIYPPTGDGIRNTIDKVNAATAAGLKIDIQRGNSVRPFATTNEKITEHKIISTAIITIIIVQ